MRPPRRTLIALVCGLACASGAAGADQPESPLSTADELATFRLSDDRLIIELIVAEPDVVDPVACAWDADGRLYVAEMRDYPTGPPGGAVKQLVDLDGDGRYERVTIFAEGLPFPNGVLPWRDGVLVTSAPDVLFLRDVDGDGQADEKKTVLTGFAEGNQQLRVNGLMWGLDGWIYGANGRSDGAILKPGDDPSRAISLRLHDFRFKPDTGEVETTTGFSQFGLARDDWGNRFLSWNTNPMRHVVFEESDLARNPSANMGGVAPMIAPTDSSRIYPISRSPQTFNRESVHHFNASCGVHVYRGDLLPESFYGNILVCEPLTNLVHRRRLEPSGPTFTAVRDPLEQDRELLASTDPWFRPVNLTTGPDGALYVVDFYRKWVEHPQFIPPDMREKVDFRTGDDKGRIWRIRQKDRQVPRIGTPHLSKVSAATLAEQFDSSNAWQRDTAQRLLIERGDKSVVPRLEQVLQGDSSPQAKALALWTIEQLGGLTDEQMQYAMGRKAPQLRQSAIKIARRRLERSEGLQRALIRAAEDAAPEVRFQAVLALTPKESPYAFFSVASRDPNDRWARAAIVLAAGGYEQYLLSRFEQSADIKRSQPWALCFDLGKVIGLKGGDTLRDYLNRLSPNDVSLHSLAGASAGAELRGASIRDDLEKTFRPEQKETVLSAVLAWARQIAVHPQAPAEQRLVMAQFLCRTYDVEDGEQLQKFLLPESPPEVQSTAARAIGRLNDAPLATKALEQWPVLSILARRDLLTALASKPTLATLVAQAIEDDTIAATDVDITARDALLQTSDAELKSRLTALLKPAETADRSVVLKEYQAALAHPGDLNRGASVFVHNCVTCHAIRGRGAKVGPDLSGVGARPPAALLVDILDPSRDVAPESLSYVLATDDGEIKTGILAGEGPTAITLRQPEGQEVVVERSRIAKFQATGKSLMPGGFEQKITPAQLADLLAFLREPDPELIQPARPVPAGR